MCFQCFGYNWSTNCLFGLITVLNNFQIISRYYIYITISIINNMYCLFWNYNQIFYWEKYNINSNNLMFIYKNTNIYTPKAKLHIFPQYILIYRKNIDFNLNNNDIYLYSKFYMLKFLQSLKISMLLSESPVLLVTNCWTSHWKIIDIHICRFHW
jgi:hypothetical protein